MPENSESFVPFTREVRNKRMLSMWKDEGIHFAEIARREGLCHQQVARIFRKMVPEDPFFNRDFAAARPAAQDLKQQGLTHVEIGRRLGYSSHYVGYMIAVAEGRVVPGSHPRSARKCAKLGTAPSTRGGGPAEDEPKGEDPPKATKSGHHGP